MSIEKEKKIIYELMREIIAERRELSKQYFDLKCRLDQLEKKECKELDIKTKPLTIIEKEMIKQKDFLAKENKAGHCNSFDRVSKHIVSILKQSPTPLSNKQIFYKLHDEYEIAISLKNLTCNILPKMINERSLPVQKAYRRYWQYKRLA